MTTEEQIKSLETRVADLERSLAAMRDGLKSYTYDGYNNQPADLLGRKILRALGEAK